MSGPPATSAHAYRAHGLRVETPFPCPELPPAARAPNGEPGAPADVVVRLGETPDALDGPAVRGAAFAATPDELLLAVPRVGRFHVRRGREVTITPDGGDEEALRVLLLGSCLGAVLHQRGVLALHASAVRVGGGAVLLLGESGAGKSTLAAALARRGADALADDLVAVVPGADGAPHTPTRTAQLKVWADVAARVHADAAGLRRVRAGLEKFALPVAAPEAPAPVPVRHAFVLVADNEPTVRLEPLGDAERFVELTRHTYRYRFLGGAAPRGGHFRRAALTAARVPVTRVRRPRHPFLLDELAERVLAAAAGG